MSENLTQSIELIASCLKRSAGNKSITVRRDALAALFREYHLLLRATDTVKEGKQP
jgi:hypothetical protein